MQALDGESLQRGERRRLVAGALEHFFDGHDRDSEPAPTQRLKKPPRWADGALGGLAFERDQEGRVEQGRPDHDRF
jgi:hypothetical protein